MPTRSTRREQRLPRQRPGAAERERRLLREIVAASDALSTLYRTRPLGQGPDPHWSARVSRLGRALDDLYAELRAVRARASALRRATRPAREVAS